MGQPLIFRLIDKAVFDYNLIKPGDKILVGASGGKDSTALIEYFANRIKRPKENFSFAAFHVHSEITDPLNQELAEILKSWNVEIIEKYIDVLGRLKKNHKMNCWWCSTQRRTELLDYAIKNGFNKIALGHHLDDILETLLMNALDHGEFSTMPVKLQYEKYPVQIIRPLCYVPVNLIKNHVEKAGYKSITCTCNFQDNSARKRAREKLNFLTDSSDEKKQKLFASLKNMQKEYLP